MKEVVEKAAWLVGDLVNVPRPIGNLELHRWILVGLSIVNNGLTYGIAAIMAFEAS